MSPPRPRRIFVFDSPRCCSHLFRKLFSAHPQLTHIDVPFFAPWMGPESVTRSISHSAETEKALEDLPAKAPQTVTLGITYAEAASRLTNAIAAAERGEQLDSVSGLPELTGDANSTNVGNTIFIQDHAPFTMQAEVVLSILRDPQSQYATAPSQLPTNMPNPTHVPADILHSVQPVLLVRDPLLSVPSMYRVQKPWTKNSPTDEEFRILGSQRWTRILFDWFKMQGREAIVVDAENLIQDVEGQTRVLCERLGIDPSGVQTSWNALPVEKQPPDEMMRWYMKGIWASSGVVKTEKRELDIKTEFEKWKVEFGEQTAEDLRERVEEEMINYRYLQQFALRT